MKKIGLSVIIITLFILTACKDEKKEPAKDNEKTEEVTKAKSETPKKKQDENERNEVVVRLESKSGSSAVGQLIFKEVNGIVHMAAKFRGLESGTHAIHIHENADCSSSDGKSAGGHWNPTFENHGEWGSENGYHKGDIGNIEVGDNGFGQISFNTDEWCLGCGDEKKDILGKAIIVHQGTDDFKSQPTGDAGARVSCGGIIR